MTRGERVVAYDKNYPGIWLEELQKSTNLSDQDNLVTL
jgi:hypothetical protein